MGTLSFSSRNAGQNTADKTMAVSGIVSDFQGKKKKRKEKNDNNNEFNHNYIKILESDWSSTALISAVIVQLHTSCACNCTVVCVMPE